MAVLDVDRRVLVLALARMADSAGNSFLIVVLPLYIASGVVSGHAFGLTETLVTGVILSMFGLLNSVGQPFVGRYSDRLGKRRVFILFGLGTLAVTNAAYAFTDSYLPMLLVRALQGIGVAFTIPSTIALVNELASDDTRGGNMGLFNTFRLLGFGAGPVVAGAVVHGGPYALGGLALSGFDAAFGIAAVGAAVSFALVAAFVSDPESLEADAGDELSVAIRGDGHLLDPVFTLGVASLFMAIGIALLSTIEPRVNEHLGQSATMFGVEFAAFVLAQVLLQAPVGRASDRYGRKPFIVAGLALLVPATFAQGYVGGPLTAGGLVVSGPWQMVTARFVQGIAGAMVFAPAFALAGDLAKKGQSGTQLSVLTMSFGLGTAVGPLTSGALIRFGYRVPFVFGAALAALGLVLVYTQVEETVSPGSSSDADTPSGASNPNVQD